ALGRAQMIVAFPVERLLIRLTSLRGEYTPNMLTRRVLGAPGAPGPATFACSSSTRFLATVPCINPGLDVRFSLNPRRTSLPFDRAKRVTRFGMAKKEVPKHAHYARINHSHGESSRIAWKSLPRIGGPRRRHRGFSVDSWGENASRVYRR